MKVTIFKDTLFLDDKEVPKSSAKVIVKPNGTPTVEITLYPDEIVVLKDNHKTKE